MTQLWRFVVVDRMSNTVGMGLIDFALRRTGYPLAIRYPKQSRAEQKSQQPRLIWFTGLSGSGKSSIANILEKLQSMGRHTITLGGDN